ncbi:hypothetical protein ACSU1N_03575 [Thermogladius sp. 4427co]|uniref:hypothetical protein n=1 Tax=Thermogladius sp. 4427co TaxID=3450718 RepID=UPI003F79B43D
MKKTDLFILLYTILSSLSNIWLTALGEDRWDVYVVLNILSFYISTAVTRPAYSKRSYYMLLNAIMIGVFTILVAKRVYEVLYA